MANDMFLYWGSGSAPCWRALLVLKEKNLKYNEKIISFEKKEHKSEEILKINPRGQVPTFKHGDLVINESFAICEYLESTFQGQGTRLIPADSKERALVLQRAFEAQNIQSGCITELVFVYMRTKEEDRKEEEMNKKKETCRKEIQLWESYLGKLEDKSFVAGKNFSMADCVFFPFLAFLVRMGLNLSRYPKLGVYYNLVKERPSVQATWPPHWKGSEGKTVLQDI